MSRGEFLMGGWRWSPVPRRLRRVRRRAASSRWGERHPDRPGAGPGPPTASATFVVTRSPGRRGVSRTLVGMAVVATLVAGACGSDEGAVASSTTASGAAPSWAGGEPVPNPHLGPVGTSTMHADGGSSDATAVAGPGTGRVEAATVELGAVCPAVLVGGDERPVALCTRVADLRPVVHLLDPDTGESDASLVLAAGGLFGGVYGYLDDRDRLVMVEGDTDLVRVAHRREDGGWVLAVDERTALAGAVPDGDTVTSVAPGVDGGVWFATEGGVVGVVDTEDGRVETSRLEPGERVANSISTAPVGTAVAGDHALYLFARGADGRPERRWRRAYDRGPARKPGQLSWGTGSTPTFFGPTDGADYVAVVDNADPEVHLVVVATGGPDAGEEVCAPVVLGEGGPGSENSPIGRGRTVIVTSTYGYEYPRLPEGAGPSRPASAPFEGGMTRVDVAADGSGCDVVWDSPARSAAVPRLSTADGTITTLTRPGAAARYAYAVIDAETGALLTEQDLGPDVGDPLQLAGTIGPDRVLWQGTVGAVERIAPAEG